VGAGARRGSYLTERASCPTLFPLISTLTICTAAALTTAATVVATPREEEEEEEEEEAEAEEAATTRGAPQGSRSSTVGPCLWIVRTLLKPLVDFKNPVETPVGFQGPC
jgi:hypothetical protein